MTFPELAYLGKDIVFNVVTLLISLLRQLLSYHDWLEHLGRDRPSAFEVSNMKKLKEIYMRILNS